MSRTSIAATLTELVALLGATNGTPVTALSTAGVVRVYGYEPGAEGIQKPCAVTVSFSGLEPTDTLFAVRVYVTVSANPSAAQDLLIAAVDACDDALRDGAAYGPSGWDCGWVPELGCWVGVCQVRAGREDGF